MAFDDGILKIYETKDIAEAGMKPQIALVLKGEHYFDYETIGVTRHYKAKQADTLISSVVCIWQDRTITGEDICILEDGLQYKCEFVQHTLNEDGLPITRITLERSDENYVISKNL